MFVDLLIFTYSFLTDFLTGSPVSESIDQSLDGLISPFSLNSCNFFSFFSLQNITLH